MHLRSAIIASIPNRIAWSRCRKANPTPTPRSLCLKKAASSSTARSTSWCTAATSSSANSWNRENQRLKDSGLRRNPARPLRFPATISSVATSLFDLYKIGVGPSSSHTMGPMRAACRFARELSPAMLDRVARVQVDLYGSLALTGKGHATDRAVLLGLEGNEPSAIDPAAIESTVAAIRAAQRINLARAHAIAFDEPRDLIFHRNQMFPPGAVTQHPNGIRLSAYDASGAVLVQRTFFSIGGGFIAEDGDSDRAVG